MQIDISDSRKIIAVKREFSKMFPFLKLEFFSKLHKSGAGSSKQNMEDENKTLGECRKVHKNGTITIVPEMTVTELEQKFASLYGLSLQIFRKSGKVWLETTVTDGWTLKEQNQHGMELSDPNYNLHK